MSYISEIVESLEHENKDNVKQIAAHYNYDIGEAFEGEDNLLKKAAYHELAYAIYEQEIINLNLQNEINKMVNAPKEPAVRHTAQPQPAPQKAPEFSPKENNSKQREINELTQKLDKIAVDIQNTAKQITKTVQEHKDLSVQVKNLTKQYQALEKLSHAKTLSPSETIKNIAAIIPANNDLYAKKDQQASVSTAPILKPSEIKNYMRDLPQKFTEVKAKKNENEIKLKECQRRVDEQIQHMTIMIGVFSQSSAQLAHLRGYGYSITIIELRNPAELLKNFQSMNNSMSASFGSNKV